MVFIARFDDVVADNSLGNAESNMDKSGLCVHDLMSVHVKS